MQINIYFTLFQPFNRLSFFYFQLTGAGLAAIGIWFQIDDTILEVLDFVEVASDDNLLMYGSYLLIAVGGVAMIFAIFGLIAAIKRNACMLGTVSIPRNGGP